MLTRLSAGRPELTETARAELDAAMQAFLPDAPLTWMISLGADAVAAEMAAAQASGRDPSPASATAPAAL